MANKQQILNGVAITLFSAALIGQVTSTVMNTNALVRLTTTMESFASEQVEAKKERVHLKECTQENKENIIVLTLKLDNITSEFQLIKSNYEQQQDNTGPNYGCRAGVGQKHVYSTDELRARGITRPDEHAQD